MQGRHTALTFTPKPLRPDSATPNSYWTAIGLISGLLNDRFPPWSSTEFVRLCGHMDLFDRPLCGKFANNFLGNRGIDEGMHWA